MMPEEIHTARLLLKRLRTNELGTQDLEWFHHIWSNDIATQWSSRGPCRTKEESQQWMAGVLPTDANADDKVAFAVFNNQSETDSTSLNEPGHKNAIGIVTLLPTKAPFGEENTEASALELGYIFHPESWGKGYATEAVQGLLLIYKESREAEKTDVLVDIRGNVHSENTPSLRVMKKAGFLEVARFEQNGHVPAFLMASKSTVVHFKMSH